MFSKLRERYRSFLTHPVVQLELRRGRRRRWWWSGRRFFIVGLVLLGVLLGYSVVLAVGDPLDSKLAAVVTGVPFFCLLGAVESLLAFALPWIAPVFTASTIARERELGTLDLLRVTLLSERSIVLGKLGACIVRLWPGIRILLLLSPLRIASVVGGRVVGATDLFSILTDLASGAQRQWVWLFMAGVLEMLRPWSGLAFHAAVGMFVSALVRSSSMAIAVSYAAIITVRGTLWVGQTVFFGLLTVLFLERVSTASDATWMVPGLLTGVIVLGEVAAAVLLLWAAVRRLKRE